MTVRRALKHVLRPRGTVRDERDEGAGVVEFALAALVFVLLVFALLELARWAYLSNAVTLVAQEAARLAAGDPSLSDAEIKALAVERAVGLDPAELELTITRYASPRRVEVVARYPYRPVVRLGVLTDVILERRTTLAY